MSAPSPTPFRFRPVRGGSCLVLVGLILAGTACAPLNESADLCHEELCVSGGMALVIVGLLVIWRKRHQQTRSPLYHDTGY